MFFVQLKCTVRDEFCFYFLVVCKDIARSCFEANKDMVAHMGGYEAVSKSMSWDPSAMASIAPLVKGLLQLSPSAEINPAPVRQALLRLLAHHPTMNKSQFNGVAWANLRSE